MTACCTDKPPYQIENKIKMCLLLIQHKSIDLNLKNRHGKTALDILMQQKRDREQLQVVIKAIQNKLLYNVKLI